MLMKRKEDNNKLKEENKKQQKKINYEKRKQNLREMMKNNIRERIFFIQGRDEIKIPEGHKVYTLNQAIEEINKLNIFERGENLFISIVQVPRVVLNSVILNSIVQVPRVVLNSVILNSITQVHSIIM